MDPASQGCDRLRARRRQRRCGEAADDNNRRGQNVKAAANPSSLRGRLWGRLWGRL
jgi:hypothetical protein